MQQPGKHPQFADFSFLALCKPSGGCRVTRIYPGKSWTGEQAEADGVWEPLRESPSISLSSSQRQLGVRVGTGTGRASMYRLQTCSGGKNASNPHGFHPKRGKGEVKGEQGREQGCLGRSVGTAVGRGQRRVLGDLAGAAHNPWLAAGSVSTTLSVSCSLWQSPAGFV